MEPRIRWAELPDGQQDAGRICQSNLDALASYVRDLRTAVEIFDYAFEQRGPPPFFMPNQDFFPWLLVAARQGILSVYNYRMAFKGVRSQLRQSEALRLQAIGPDIERNKETFDRSFPNLAELRQTVLHDGELLWNQERDRENRNRKDYSGPLGEFAGNGSAIKSGIGDRTYTATFSGSVVEFEMSSLKVEQLEALRSDLIRALRL